MSQTNGALHQLRQNALDLSWSLWAELGVSSWRRAHQEWAVELEPLIAFTALLGDKDPRLFREAVDWCVTNDKFVSLKQYRHVVTSARWPFAGLVGDFGATVAAHTKRNWPIKGEPRLLSLSGKSTAPDLRLASTVSLRMRALFGVGARAEIIRVMLLRPRAWTIRQVADRVAYTQRQITSDLDMLVAGGLVSRVVGPPAQFTITSPRRLAALVQPLPRHAPNWASVFRVLHGVLEGLENATTASAPGTHLVRTVRRLDGDIEASGLALPQPDGSPHYADTVREWSLATFGALAEGIHRPLERHS